MRFLQYVCKMPIGAKCDADIQLFIEKLLFLRHFYGVGNFSQVILLQSYSLQFIGSHPLGFVIRCKGMTQAMPNRGVGLEKVHEYMRKRTRLYFNVLRDYTSSANEGILHWTTRLYFIIKRTYVRWLFHVGALPIARTCIGHYIYVRFFGMAFYRWSYALSKAI